jgi:hypothetical protein
MVWTVLGREEEEGKKEGGREGREGKGGGGGVNRRDTRGSSD